MSFSQGFRRRVIFTCEGASMTSQAHKDETDINLILSQYKRTGILTHISKHSANYMDLPSNYDYQDSMNTILQAQDAFATLPSKVREHFANDPERFLRAFGDPEQIPYLRDLGILKPVASAQQPVADPPQGKPE